MKRTSIKNISLLSILYGVLWVAALLKTYAPERNYIYSKHAVLLFVVFIIGMLIFGIMKNKYFIRLSMISLILWLYFIWGLFSLSTFLNASNVPQFAIVGIFNNNLTQAFVLVFAVIWVSLERNLSIESGALKMAFFFVIFGLIAGLSALQMLLTGRTLFGPLTVTGNELITGIRLKGWFASPNYLVDVVALGVFSAFYIYLSGAIKKWMSSIFLVLMLFLLIGTGSRGGILGCISGVFFQLAIPFYVERHGRKKLSLVFKYATISLITITFGYFILLVFLKTVGINFAHFLQSVLRMDPDNFSTGSGRLDMWKDGLDFIFNASVGEQLFGIGNCVYIGIYGRPLHSTYLQIMIEQGAFMILFFILFMAWYFRIVSRLTKKFKRNNQAIISIAFLATPAVYLLIRGIFQGTVFLSGNFSWLFTIISASLLLTRPSAHQTGK